MKKRLKPKLKRISTGYYEMFFENYKFEIVLTDDKDPDGDRALGVYKKENQLTNFKYCLYHKTKKECMLQLEVMLNNTFLID